MHRQAISSASLRATQESHRLYYLDWLLVIAILIVFLYHAVHRFDLTNWHFKNPEQSLALTIILVLLRMCGMAFFFQVVGGDPRIVDEHMRQAYQKSSGISTARH